MHDGSNDDGDENDEDDLDSGNGDGDGDDEDNDDGLSHSLSLCPPMRTMTTRWQHHAHEQAQTPADGEQPPNMTQEHRNGRGPASECWPPPMV